MQKKKSKPRPHRVPGSSKFARVTTASLAVAFAATKLKSSVPLSVEVVAGESDMASPSFDGGDSSKISLSSSQIQPCSTPSHTSDLQIPFVLGSGFRCAEILQVNGNSSCPVVAEDFEKSPGNHLPGEQRSTATSLPVGSILSEPNPTAPAAPRTYKSLLQESSKLEEIGTPSEHVSGFPFVLIPDENIVSAKEEFKDFIYAQFHKNPPALSRIIGVVNALWARTGPRIFVHNIGPGSFLLRVTNPRVRALLLSRSHWTIAGHPMFVSSWSPEFTPESPPITEANVAVELRGVPYLLFNKESLCRIATAVGKPVAMAPETEKKENLVVAKLMVRVNLQKELPSKIISGFTSGREVEISVTYPWLPLKCQECGQYGHSELRCPLKNSVISSGKSSRRIRSRSPHQGVSEKFKPHIRKGRSWRPVRKSNSMVADISNSMVADIGTSPTFALDEASQPPSQPTGFELKTGSGQDADSDLENPKNHAAAVRVSGILPEETGLNIDILQDTVSEIMVDHLQSGCGPSHVPPIHEADSNNCGLDNTIPVVVEEEEEQPFILVTRRKGGRKAAKLH